MEPPPCPRIEMLPFAWVRLLENREEGECTGACARGGWRKGVGGGGWRGVGAPRGAPVAIQSPGSPPAPLLASHHAAAW